MACLSFVLCPSHPRDGNARAAPMGDLHGEKMVGISHIESRLV